jgi:hypothetical protein
MGKVLSLNLAFACWLIVWFGLCGMVQLQYPPKGSNIMSSPSTYECKHYEEVPALTAEKQTELVNCMKTVSGKIHSQSFGSRSLAH